MDDLLMKSPKFIHRFFG
jgi:hypothetical protein